DGDAGGRWRGERGLAVGCYPGQLALVPQPPKPAGFGRKRISVREACTGYGWKEPAVVAIETLKLALLERTHAVADVVADAIGGVDQRVIPIREKQGGERVRLVMVDKAHRNVGAEPVVGQKPIRPEERQRVLNPEPATEGGDVALGALAAELALPGVVQFVDQRKAIVLGREIASHERNGVDIGANPARRPQHLVDGKPGDFGPPAFVPDQALLLNGGEQFVIVERGGRGVMDTGMNRQNPHKRGHLTPAAATGECSTRAAALRLPPRARPSS